MFHALWWVFLFLSAAVSLRKIQILPLIKIAKLKNASNELSVFIFGHAEKERNLVRHNIFSLRTQTDFGGIFSNY